MIGIIGGYGDIGREVIEALYNKGYKDLLIGGRHQKDLFQDHLGIQYHYVDLEKRNTIENFVERCTVVINCSGRTSHQTESLITSIQKYKCRYIEPQFNTLLENLRHAGDNIFVHGVGSMPGLSGVLPIFLGQDFDQIQQLKMYYIGQGKFTPQSALDYLNGIKNKDNYSMVCYEKGKIIPHFSKEEEFLPVFNDNYKLLPYYDKEAGEICRILKPQRAEFYTAIEDNLTYRVLKKIREKYKNNPQHAIEDLCNTSLVDNQKGKNCGFIVSLKGIKRGKREDTTLILKADGAGILTGTVLAEMADIVNKTDHSFDKNILSMWEYQIQDRCLGKKIINNSSVSANLYPCGIEELSVIEEGEI